MSEDLDVKAGRYLTKGRVRLHQVTGQSVLASVRGDTGAHLIAIDAHGSICLCPAKGDRCSHIRAVALVTYPPRKETPMDHDPEITEPEDDLGPQPAELAAIDPESDPTLLPLASTAISYRTLSMISSTEFVPAGLRGRPDALLACVLYGRELGLGAMQSLAHIDVIDGRPSPSAELLNRLIREAGHTIEVVESTEKVCTLRGTRKDAGETQELSFSIEDAQRAGLTSRPAWKAYPADLLWARPLTRLARRLFPDAGRAGSPEGVGGPDLEDPA